jgi:uncharacterized membrane protein YccF (DUF307 family)
MSRAAIYLSVGMAFWLAGEHIAQPTRQAVMRGHGPVAIVAATIALIAVWPLAVFTFLVREIKLATLKWTDRSD